MAKSTISIGSASAAVGKRATGFIKVGEMPDGSAINVPVIILNGSKDGPTVWLHALEDGNEYPGCLALMDLGVELASNLSEMSGAVVAIPAVNITAFRGNPWGGGIRNSPADLDGGIPFPRQYPGNANGGFTAQSAAALWEPLTKNANYFITCHGSGEIYGIDRVLLFKSEAPAFEKAVELAKAMNMKIMLTTSGDPKRGKSVIETLNEMGIASVSVESNGGPGGVGLGTDPTTIKNSILNALRFLKVINGNVEKIPKQILVHYEKGSGGIFSHRGGFFRPFVKVEQQVSEGQEIGAIYNWFGDSVETIKSPVNGIVLGYWGKCPQIGSGQYRVAEIAVPNAQIDLVKSIMVGEIKVRNVVAEKGTKASGLVRVYNTSTWPLELPVTIVNGSKDGPVLCLTAGFHPHEYTGIETVIRLANKIQPKDVSGAVIALPCVNVGGFQKRMRNNPVDDANMHREFPGNPKGKSSQQVAWFLSQEVFRQSTHYIDNHGSDFGEVAPNHVIYPLVGNAKVDEVSGMMGKCFNGDYLRSHKATDTLSALSWAASNGIPSILSEAGQLGGLTLGQLDENDIAWNTNGILNTMKYLKMIDGSPSVRQPIMIVNEAHLSASVAGMFYSKVKIGDKVRIGQVVGEVRDMFGNLKEELKAPINGVISLIWFYTAVEAGGNLIQILETSS